MCRETLNPVVSCYETKQHSNQNLRGLEVVGPYLQGKTTEHVLSTPCELEFLLVVVLILLWKQY